GRSVPADADGLDDDRGVGFVRGGGHRVDRIDDGPPGADEAEDGVFAVEVRGGGGGDEKLGPVGVRSAVGHGDHVGAGVGETSGELVLERVSGAVGAV